MVKHVLFVKMKNPSHEECEKVKALFLSMKEQIDFIRDLQVGIDYLHSERSYDVVLELIVDDRQALEDYQKNAYHVEKVKPYIHAVRSGSATVDYEY
ncbi:Dabb family protein [[Clostridium] innocuum]|nr:Dabb family protein [[Clostridium] innocuum]